MGKIAIFDSGMGSLSIITAIQKKCNCNIVYFADQKNFPYGKKTKNELGKIVKKTINGLEKIFNPELIVIGSNTPSLLLDIDNKKIIGVSPPICEASLLSKTKNIAVLGTSSLISSGNLSDYIKNSKMANDTIIHKINASKLVELVESGKFLTNKDFCKLIIQKEFYEIFTQKNIDVCTLSSTHLPFLKNELELIFPKIHFIDPADIVAQRVCKKNINVKTNTLEIYSSDSSNTFQKNLEMLGIRNHVNFLSF